jgi:hemoglobin/transferrin/lactoferrin receptor protein
MSSAVRPARAALLAFLGFVAPAAALAQSAPDSTKKVQTLAPVVVTATRTPKSIFEAPAPVHLIDSETIRGLMPNSAADLLRELPGVDVAGVGTNQVRPIIRGQQGQRILLLEDGIRLNNSRRQQDFGEIPALVDVNDLDRVEVVRGPASVLYGTDAIGGVVNLISPEIARRNDERLHGQVGISAGTEDDKRRPSGFIEQRLGNFAYRLSGSYRETRDYRAPAGSFGNVTLADDERVHDSGVRDQSYGGVFTYDLAPRQRLTARVQRYEADDAGFGYVSPDALGEDQPLIRILYPNQQVERYSLSYRGTGIRSALADRVEVTTYAMDNERRLSLDIFVPFGPGTPPGAGVGVESFNYTDMLTLGARAEATKILGGRHQLTYGLDVFRDRSRNSDSSVTTIVGFGPPMSETSTRPQVPNATFRSVGAFVQSDLRLAERLSVVLGVRGQDVRAETRETDGLTAPTVSSSDRTVVGAANVMYRIARPVMLVGTLSRGFRSPNLVERFFDGPTPEGNGYQRANTDLEPEKSVNVDLGTRVETARFTAEAFWFRNTIRDGIRISPTGETIQGLPGYQNVNVDKLRYTGVELSAGVDLGLGFDARGSYTHLESKDVLNPNNPIAAGNADKMVGELGYRDPRGRFWLGYVVRHNARQREAQIAESPVGDALPAFTVMGVRGGLRLFDRAGLSSSLAVRVDNLTNELYAESANTSFFRPEPGRGVSVSWIVGF